MLKNKGGIAISAVQSIIYAQAKQKTKSQTEIIHEASQKTQQRRVRLAALQEAPGKSDSQVTHRCGRNLRIVPDLRSRTIETVLNASLFLLISVFLLILRFHIPYASDDGTSTDSFNFPIAIVIFPTLAASIAGYTLGFIAKEGQTVSLGQQWLSGVLYFLLLFLTNTSLLYVSFPTQLIFRNCRLLAIVLVGIFFSRVKHDDLKLGKSKLLVGLVITVGVILFSTGNHRSGNQKGNDPIGIALLVLSMIVDGFMVDNQAYVKILYKPTANMLFKCTSLYTFIISTIYSICTGELIAIFDFLMTHRAACYDLLLVSIVGCTGQMAIYYLVAHFKQNVVPIVSSTRKIFTLLLSLFVYNHQLASIQWVGICVVFTGVGLEFLDERNQKKKHQVSHAATKKNLMSPNPKGGESTSSSSDEQGLKDQDTQESISRKDTAESNPPMPGFCELKCTVR